MKIKNQVPLERLIGKIDNDFNISDSDWIPRVAAWTIDALSQMQCLPFQRKQRTLEVSNKIAQFPCTINALDIKVFDKNGCPVPSVDQVKVCDCVRMPRPTLIEQRAVFDPTEKNPAKATKVGYIINEYDRNYVLSGNQIHLNFDTDYIVVESYEIATYFDDYYNTEVPYIYDNGLLLEALSWYVLFKHLSRGNKHTVYSLTSSNPTLNPMIQWNTLRPKAMASTKIDMSNDSTGWNNFFFNSTFRPRG